MSAQPQDHWNHEAYDSAASFVPQLATKVVQWLDPQPQDSILDIGCGDGVLTASIAAIAASVVGLDASPAMIQSASSQISARHPNASFHVVDCTNLSSHALAAVVPAGQTYTKVFSSAAMHWILRDESIRQSFFDQVFALTAPGGAFVFEMGGFGNVADASAATFATLGAKYGVSRAALDQASPWYFASVEWMQATLARAGFAVEKIEAEYRPTQLTAKKADKTGGLHGWVRLMCAQMLQEVPEAQRDAAADDIVEVLERSNVKEDGSEWLGYVRLRAVAKRT